MNNPQVSSILGVDRLVPNPDPFPHVLVDGFFKPELYTELREQFPDIRKLDRPKGWGQSLYLDDSEYQQHLDQNPAWKNVANFIYSQTFIDFMIEQFGEHWEREGCKLNLSRAHFVPYVEDRTDKERFELRKVAHEPDALWSRLDFYQSYAGYYRPVHLDHRRRLISMLVYFDDKQEIGMEGGELLLHREGTDLSLLNKLGIYHAPKPFSKLRDRFNGNIRIEPRKNRMAVFICGRRSWHSVPAIRSTRLPRQHVHIVVSSSSDAWE